MTRTVNRLNKYLIDALLLYIYNGKNVLSFLYLVNFFFFSLVFLVYLF